MEKGGLQCLTHLNLSECFDLKGKLDSLPMLPQLQHLNLIKTKLEAGDLRALCLACNGRKKTLPKLTSLCLSLPADMRTSTASNNLFELPWPYLKEFYLFFSETRFTDRADFLYLALKENKLPNLGCVRIQHDIAAVPIRPINTIHHHIENLIFHNCILPDDFEHILPTLSQLNIESCKAATRYLSQMLLQGPLLLITLVLCDCELTSQDLSSLAQTAVKGMLPELKHLDLSCNRITGEGSMSLFDSSCSWNHLVSLHIGDNLLDEKDAAYFMRKVETDGLLGSLHELGTDNYPAVETIWPNMKALYLSFCDESTFCNISDAVDQGYFPVLGTICVEKFESYDASLVRTLQKRNIYCHEAIAPFYDPLARVRCYCQITQTEEY